jgi:ATP-dependent RNA helicase RhlB
VQAATLPRLLEGRDVAAQAQTGTGKTAAYLISVFAARHGSQARLPPPAGARDRAHPRAGRADPGRRLRFCRYVAPRIVTVFGGIDYGKQRDPHDGCDILIGTPGRLLDYSNRARPASRRFRRS